MTPFPEKSEAAPYFFRYIDRVASPDIEGELEKQEKETLALLSEISEEKSLYRYAPGKWSVRQLWNHVNDCERLFLSRAFWFARGFDDALPSFEQDDAAVAARADDFPWSSHVEDFRAVRSSTRTFFRNLPEAAWTRGGTASGNPFTVRALAFIIVGHAAHHTAVLKERYF